MKRALAALALTFSLVACSADDGRSQAELDAEADERVAALRESVSASVQAEQEAQAARPRLRVTQRSTCDNEYPTVFVTGDGSENTATGLRFIADVTVSNRGNVRASALISVRWLLVGGDVVRSDHQRVELRPGQSRTLGFTQPATQDEIARMGAHAFGDKLCEVGALAGRA